MSALLWSLAVAGGWVTLSLVAGVLLALAVNVRRRVALPSRRYPVPGLATPVRAAPMLPLQRQPIDRPSLVDAS